MMRYRGSGGRRGVAGVGWVAWELRLDPTQPPRRGWDPGSVVVTLSWLLNLTPEDIPRYVGICIRSGRPRRRWYNICPEELLEIICYQDLKEKLCQPDFHLTMPCTALVCNCAAWRYDCQTDDNGGFKSNSKVGLCVLWWKVEMWKNTLCTGGNCRNHLILFLLL